MGSNTETYTKTFSIDIERANYHLKCKKRRRKRLFIVLFVWLLIFVYLFTFASKVNLKVTGNVYYSKEELMKISYISKNDFWWLVDTKKAKKVLNSYEYIDEVEFSKSILGVKLKIKEVYPVGIKNDKYVMSNKQIIEKNAYDKNEIVGDIADFNSIENADLDNLIEKYKGIDLKVRKHFNKLEIVKSEIEENEFYSYVKLHGYDDRIGMFIIKVDLVYLNTKFNGNKYNKIIEEISENNVKYNERPALIAYHEMDEEEFELVESFKEETGNYE